MIDIGSMLENELLDLNLFFVEVFEAIVPMLNNKQHTIAILPNERSEIFLNILGCVKLDI
jgi:hypothetical protein